MGSTVSIAPSTLSPFSKVTRVMSKKYIYREPKEKVKLGKT